MSLVIYKGRTGVDNSGGGAGVDSVFGRTGEVVAENGDYSVAEVTGAAPLASPTFTGVPAAPTAAPGTNTTQLATTEFVQAAAGGANPLQGGVAKSSGIVITSGTILDIGTITLPAGSWHVFFNAGLTDSNLAGASLTSLEFWIDTVEGNAGVLEPSDDGSIVPYIGLLSDVRDLPLSFAGKVYSNEETLYLKAKATGSLFSATTQVYGFIRAVNVLEA